MKKIFSILVIILFMSTSLVLAKDFNFTGVPINKVWTAVMTDNIDYSTLINSSVTVTNNKTKVTVPITLSPAHNKPKAFLIQPNQNYDYNTTYTISIKNLRNTSKKPMKAERFVTFTTVAKDQQSSSDDSNITIGSVPDKSITEQDYAFQVTKELSDDKYKGRLSGTDSYKADATYIANVFQSLGLNQVDGTSNYLQNYSTTLANYNTMPTLKINGKDLVMYKDFKPHGNTPSTNLNISNTVFVGYGYNEDFNNVDVKGKNVLFLADVKSGTSMGVLDRVNLAKSKGAVSTLIIPNKYTYMSSSEKPIKYDQGQIPCIYITRYVAQNLLSINVDSDSIGKQSSANIQATIDVNRQAQATSYNVLGMVKGKSNKTIVISASLDGYGSLPNGRVFNGASADASGVGVIASLAKYYSVNQPNYNILFAGFGNQTTEMEGSNYFVNNYKDIKNIICDIDIYDVGCDGRTADDVGQQYTDLHNTIKNLNDNNYIIDTGEDVNYPFSNNYQFSTKGIANVFVRCLTGDSSEDSLNDKINLVNINGLNRVINHVRNIVNNYPADKTQPADNPQPSNDDDPSYTSFDSSKVGHEYVATIDKTLNTYELKHIKLYYTDNFKSAIKDMVNNSDLADQVFEQDEWWNSYPKLPGEKLKVYCVNDWDDGWKVTKRLDKKGLGEHSGGYQSFVDFSLSVIRLDSDPGSIASTIAHEFNHKCADLTPIGNTSQSDVDNQEICGHVYSYTVGWKIPTAKWYFKCEVLPKLLVASNKANFINENNWSEYTGNQIITPDQWAYHYDKLACTELYIWQKYSKEKCRQIQFDFYADPRPSVKSVIEKELNISFSQFLSDCFDWYQMPDASSYQG